MASHLREERLMREVVIELTIKTNSSPQEAVRELLLALSDYPAPITAKANWVEWPEDVRSDG
jgi:hypothetical protein